VTSLEGVLASGLGQGAHFTQLEWVRHAIRRMIGFDPYPGTLNLRLVDTDMLRAWRRIRKGPALVLIPPPPEQCRARLFPAVVAQDVRAAVVVPDVTRHDDDLIELVAAVHMRSVLGLQDNDRVRLAFFDQVVQP
jgi:riboflavin kinase